MSNTANTRNPGHRHHHPRADRLMASRLDDIFAPASTAALFDALAAADKAAHDASYNELLARTARTPDVFAHCVCGSEYTALNDTIELDSEEIAVAADALAFRFGQRGQDSVVYAHQVMMIVQAVNHYRERIALNAETDWRADHELCEVEL